jgi:hypothetical protein
MNADFGTRHIPAILGSAKLQNEQAELSKNAQHVGSPWVTSDDFEPHPNH